MDGREQVQDFALLQECEHQAQQPALAQPISWRSKLRNKNKTRDMAECCASRADEEEQDQ